MSEPLTLAEAVPLGTVHLQRLLAAAGIRSLVIKGPAFVELGVRKPKQSNDIDLLVAPEDYASAKDVLVRAGWKVVSYSLPPALEHTKYSVTLRHNRMPVTVDLHQRFEGMLTEDLFAVLWQARAMVVLAHQEAVTVGHEHALLMESLNATKGCRPSTRAAVASRVLDECSLREIAPQRLADAAMAVGSRHTAADLIAAAGGPSPAGEPSAEEGAWLAKPCSYTRADLLWDTLRRAPLHLPRVLWEQFLLTPDAATFWALTNDVAYRNRVQILWLRARRKLPS